MKRVLVEVQVVDVLDDLKWIEIKFSIHVTFNLGETELTSISPPLGQLGPTSHYR